MPSAHRIAVAVGVLALLALIGTVGGGLASIQYHTLPASDPGAIAVTERSIAALQSVTAYTYTVSGRVTATKGTRRRSIDVTGSGAVNRTTRRLRIELSGDDDHEALYVDGYTRYEPCPWSRFENVEDAWYGTALDRNYSWWRYTTLGNLRRLQRMSRVYDRGHATVAGASTRVLVFRPDLNRLRALQRRLRPRDDISTPERAWVRNVTVRVWLSTDTHYPVKLRVTRVSHTGPLFGVKVVERFAYTYDYGPTAVEPPPRRVPNRTACPGPSAIDDAD